MTRPSTRPIARLYPAAGLSESLAKLLEAALAFATIKQQPAVVRWDGWPHKVEPIQTLLAEHPHRSATREAIVDAAISIHFASYVPLKDLAWHYLRRWFR